MGNFLININKNRDKFYNLLNQEKMAVFVKDVINAQDVNLFEHYLSEVSDKLELLSCCNNKIFDKDIPKIVGTWGAYVSAISKTSKRNVLIIILLDIAEKEKIDLSMSVAKKFFNTFLKKTSSNEILNELFSGLTYLEKENKFIKKNRTIKEKIATKEFNLMFDHLIDRYSKRINATLNAERDFFNDLKLVYRNRFNNLLERYEVVKKI